MEKKDDSSTIRKALIGDKSYNKFAIIGALLALFGGVIPFLPIVGFILGIIALNQISKTKEKGKFLAICAIILGGFIGFAPILTALLVASR